MHPLRLLPLLRERPWGVRSLAPWIPAPPPAAPVGEAWFTANETPVEGASTLGDAIAADPAGVLGANPRDGSCPLLLKLLFTSERLSVQVHPDDAYAGAHHGSRGKTEAWHVLEAGPGAEVGLGFRRPIERGAAEQAARSGAIEGLLDWRPTAAGDTWLVPAGTVHAIGAGLTIAEIQEQSDITYRLYDYGRPRELHLDRGFDVADLGPYAGGPSPRRVGPGRVELTACSYFRLERWTVTGRLEFEPDPRGFRLLLVVSGTGAHRGAPVGPGHAWLVPAAASPSTWDLEGDVLVVHPGGA